MSALELSALADNCTSEADTMYHLEVQIGRVGGENREEVF